MGNLPNTLTTSTLLATLIFDMVSSIAGTLKTGVQVSLAFQHRAGIYYTTKVLPLSRFLLFLRHDRTPHAPQRSTEQTPPRRDCTVIDSWVGKFPQAVTCFSPGSYGNRPRQALEGSNVFMAGDWVKGVDHGANGLSQVRAMSGRADGRVTGILIDAPSSTVDRCPIPPSASTCIRWEGSAKVQCA